MNPATSTLLALCLALSAAHARADQAIPSWPSVALEPAQIDFARAQVKLQAPTGMRLEATPDRAEWEAEGIPRYKAPTINLHVYRTLPDSVEDATRAAVGSRKEVQVLTAEQTPAGYAVSYTVGDRGSSSVTWTRAADKVVVKCHANLANPDRSASQAQTVRWLRQICESVQTSARAEALVQRPSSSSGSQIVDQTSGLRVQLPNGWLAQPRSGDDPISFGSDARALTQGPGPDSAAGMLMLGSVAQMGSDPTALLQRFIEKSNSAQAAGAKLASLRIGGRPAARVNLLGQVGQAKVLYSYYVVIGERNVALLMGVDGSRGKLAGAIAEMAQSIQIR